MSKNTVDRRDYKTPPSSRNTGNTSRAAWLSQSSSYSGDSSHAKSKLGELSDKLDRKTRLQNEQSAAESGLANVRSAMIEDSVEMQRINHEAKSKLQEGEYNLASALNRVTSVGNTALSVLDTVEKVAGGVDSTFDEEKYNASMDGKLEQLMKIEGVNSWDDVDAEVIQGAHKAALDDAREEQGWFGKGVTGVINTADKLFTQHAALKKEQRRTVEMEKLVQSNIVPKEAISRIKKVEKDHLLKLRTMTDENGKRLDEMIDLDTLGTMIDGLSVLTEMLAFGVPEVPTLSQFLEEYAVSPGGAK